jgi:hypothetical protein
MTSGQENLLAFGLTAIAAAAAWGWFSDKSKKLKEDEFNRALRERLEQDRKSFEQAASERTKELQERLDYVTSLRAAFDQGVLSGRSWLARFVAEADKALDESIVRRLRDKQRPAFKAAEEVSLARAERRAAKEHAKLLEYQLLSYKEYFPFLEEYEDLILDEAVALTSDRQNLDALEDADPVLRFVPKAEYERLTSSERNQLALNRYLNGGLSPAAIGRLYERFVGHLYEKDGWAVEYHGIVKGLEDLGRDLICYRGNEVHIVQVKCWSRDKQIHEKHIFQLFGTTQLFLMAQVRTDLFAPSVTPRFVTTTALSEVARQAAKWLKIEVQEGFALDKTFPMIKCNVNQATGERIYHLPFDQQYDKTKISPELGERYVSTAAEAEKLGFRRAFRYTGGAR